MINKNNNEKKGVIKSLKIISLVNFILLVIFIYKFKICYRDKNNSNIIDYKNKILNLKEEMNKLSEENIKLKNRLEISNNKENKKSCEETETLTKISDNKSITYKPFFDSKIVASIHTIYFVIDYIRQNDKLFKFNDIKLLYRGSRDGDKTKTCHKLCDNKQNDLIIIQSDTGYIFGGYSKIGFKTNNKKEDREYKIDNNSFLFSIDLR